MSAFSFDATQVEPDEGRVGPMPAGWWPFMADEAALEPTKDGMGNYIKVRFTCTEGPHKGSKVWHNFNMKNNSEKAVEIGRKQLSAFMHAINVLKIDHLQQLCNVPLFLKIKFVPADGQWEAKNEINAFRKSNDDGAKAGYQAQLSGGAVAKPSAPRPPVAAPAAAAVPPPPAPGAGGWQPPAAQQPWNAAPAAAPEAPAQVQQAAPSWGTAPAAVQAPAIQSAPLTRVAPEAAPAQSDDLPPWMNDNPPME